MLQKWSISNLMTATLVRPRPTPSQEEITRGRILDAAFECAERYGLRRTTMGDVARAAGVSRQTVYRYFPTKHVLFALLALREEARLAELVRSAVAAEPDLHRAIAAGIGTALRWLREHPLLDPLLKAEPGELLPYLTTEANPLIALATRTCEEIFRERFPTAPPKLVRRAAEALGRVLLSYAITPPVESAEEVAGSLAQLFCRALSF